MFGITNICLFGYRVPKLCLPVRNVSTAAQSKVREHARVKTAILMFNMGGPKTVNAVGDYLLKIMTDRDMVQLPIQSKLGPWIAKRRTSEIQRKYAEIGGGSPILKWSNLQGELMCKQLDKISPETAPHKHYIGFRYTDPFIEEALENIERDGAEHTVIFSQYPQYSCATSGSSFNAIHKHYESKGLPNNMKLSVIDRWSSHPLLAKTFSERIKEQLSYFPADKQANVLILFSAHSLPLQAVDCGDTYPSEVGVTVHLVMNELKYCNPYQLVWQSKVGPSRWLRPSTDEALKGFVHQGKKDFILVPIAFVNEHIETLHEMDIEYCDELANKLGIEKIRRAAAPNDHPIFIDALTDIVVNHLRSNKPITPKFLMRCPNCVNENCVKSKNWYSKYCQF